MFNRAELVILSEGLRIKAISNSLADDETTDFNSVNVATSLVYYIDTLFLEPNFDRNLNPYITEGEPEELDIVTLSFNGKSYDITAAQIGKGVNINGVATWFTDDDTENGKPVTNKMLDWLDDNL